MTWTGRTFSWRHNWDKGAIIERLSWLTDLKTKRSGAEQRVRLRKHPRRALDYQVPLLDARVRRRFDAFLWAAQDEVVMCPILTDVSRLAAALSSGATSIALSTTGLDYDAGSHAMLWRDEEHYEVVEIEAVTSSALTLADPTSATWPQGTFVFPARRARLNSEAAKSSWASDREHADLTCDIVTDEVSTNRFGSYSAETYRDLEMLLAPTEGSDDLTRGVLRQLNQLDSETGTVYVDAVTTAPAYETDYRRKLAGRQAISEFLGWLADKKGRWSNFWYPTWEQDFVLVGIDSPDLAVEACGYTDAYAAHASRRHVALRTNKALSPFYSKHEWIPLRFDSAVDNNDGTETLTSADAATISQLGQLGAASPADFDFVSFLRYGRLNQDQVELAWETDRLVLASLRLREEVSVP